MAVARACSVRSLLLSLAAVVALASAAPTDAATRAPLRQGRVVRSGATGIGGIAVGVVPLASATCKTCPGFDFGTFTPGSNYQLHSSSVPPGGCKVYRFVVRNQRQYRFTFCEGGGTALFDTVLTAQGTQCNALASNDDSCATKSQLDLVALADGYVYLTVSSKTGAGGSYTLAYKDLGLGPSGCRTCPSFDHGTFTPVPNWNVHSSSIGVGGCKMYRFFVSNGKTYQFSTCQGGGAASFDTVLTQYTGSCGAGASNDNACEGGASDLTVPAIATGYIYIKVSSISGGSGDFTLAYREGSGCNTQCPGFDAGPFTPPPYFQQQTDYFGGSIAPGCSQVIALNVEEGNCYGVVVCPSLDPVTGAEFPAEATIVGQDCLDPPLIFPIPCFQSGYGFIIFFEAGSDGLALVRISSEDPAAGGNYVLGYFEGCGV